MGVEELKHVAGQRFVEVGPPEGPVPVGVLDDGSRVANQRGVKIELESDWPGAPIAPACTEDRADPARAARVTAARVRGRSIPSGSSSVPSTSRAKIWKRFADIDCPGRCRFFTTSTIVPETTADPARIALPAESYPMRRLATRPRPIDREQTAH